MGDERELMYKRAIELGISIGDGTIETMFSRDNWQFFSYDSETMRFAVRPVRGMHKRMIDEEEVFLNHEECKVCLWGTKEPMVALMDCYLPNAKDFCVFARHKFMSEAEFTELYPKAVSLLL
jgi:hypothetical protein